MVVTDELENVFILAISAPPTEEYKLNVPYLATDGLSTFPVQTESLCLPISEGAAHLACARKHACDVEDGWVARNNG